MGEVSSVRRLLPLFLLSFGAATAQTSSRTNPEEALGPQRRYDAPQSAANAAHLPGNSWASILALPHLMGGSWSSGLKGLARRIVLDDLVYPPFKPQYLDQSKQRVAKILAGKADFLDASCVPWGMPRLIYHLGGPTFMEEPGVIAIFSDVARAVWMDGRPHPKQDTDPNALVELNATGDSIGRWEGDTLIIDTVGVDPRVELFYGVPNGGDMHIVEAYRMTGPNTLTLKMTVDAPHVLAKPWIYTETYTRNPEPQIVQDDCYPSDNREQADDQNGLKLDLTPPGGFPPGVSH